MVEAWVVIEQQTATDVLVIMNSLSTKTDRNK